MFHYSAQAWFFDLLRDKLDGKLVIQLVEGSKDSERQIVEIAEKRLGTYFPVWIKAENHHTIVDFH